MGERASCGPVGFLESRTWTVVGQGDLDALLVEALASRWAVLDRVPVGKTVRAELDLGPHGPARP